MGLLLCAACAALSGIDSLRKVDCIERCDDVADGSAPISPEAAMADGPADDGQDAQGDDGRGDGSSDAAPDDGPTTSDSTTASDARAVQDSAFPDRSVPPESGEGSDGTADATIDAADGAAPAFCARLSPSPLFCQDFDEGSYIPGWSSLHTMQGILALDTTEFTSPPGAMVAQSGKARAGVDVAAYRDFALTGQTFAGSIDLDLRVDRADAQGATAVLAQVNFTDGVGGGWYVLQLVAVSNAGAPLSMSFNEIAFGTAGSGVAVVHAVARTIALGTWTNVKLSATVPFTGGSGTATLSFNGAQVGTSAINAPLQLLTQTIGVGITYASTPSNGWTAVYDDVVFDATTN